MLVVPCLINAASWHLVSDADAAGAIVVWRQSNYLNYDATFLATMILTLSRSTLTLGHATQGCWTAPVTILQPRLAQRTRPHSAATTTATDPQKKLRRG